MKTLREHQQEQILKDKENDLFNYVEQINEANKTAEIDSLYNELTTLQNESFYQGDY